MSHETVEALIARVMAAHPDSTSPKRLAAYFEAVHQELAPLARALEAENATLRQQLQSSWREASAAHKASSVHVWTCPKCRNVYRGGDANVTIYAENGAVKCRACNPSTRAGGAVMVETIERKEHSA